MFTSILAPVTASSSILAVVTASFAILAVVTALPLSSPEPTAPESIALLPTTLFANLDGWSIAPDAYSPPDTPPFAIFKVSAPEVPPPVKPVLTPTDVMSPALVV